jgi:hypothetical protein
MASVLKLEAKAGNNVADYIEKAIAVAGIAGEAVECEFNGTKFIVYPSHRDQVYAIWTGKRPGEKP